MRPLRLLALLFACSGCSVLGFERAESDDPAASGGSAGSSSGGASSGSGASSGNGSGNGGSSGGNGTSGSSSGGSGTLPGLGETFRYGVNMNLVNWNWGDDQRSWLSAQAGCNSARIKLPEYHLANWGYDVELGDMQTYASHGLTNLFGFLIAATPEHSTAPAGTSEWELDHYIPKNLYQPIFLASGEVNPENYWAKYVHETVVRYKPWVRVWEVWNEPDWVDDWNLVDDWATRPPSAQDLTRFNGTVFDYIRLLRITKEVVNKADPTALVALGGLGYPTFLDAILRYTDNPASGAVSDEYPSTGASYFDVINLHYYPMGRTSSDHAVDGMLEHRDQFQAVANKYGLSGKLWHLTETGAAHVSVGGEIGGETFARNYLIKLMSVAASQGFFGVDWYALSDVAAMGSSNDPYDFMGLYFNFENVATKEQAQRTVSGTAYRTLGGLLKGARYDGDRTQALELPQGARGAAFQLPSGDSAYALWARTNGSEQATLTVSLPIDGSFNVHAWDSSLSGTTSAAQSSGGLLELELGAAPLLLVPN